MWSPDLYIWAFTSLLGLLEVAHEFQNYTNSHAHQFSLVQFSHSVMSNSMRPHDVQQARPPCPSPTPRVYSNSRPLCQWCHPTISPSVIPFSSCLQSFPASGSFQMSQFFASGGQSTGASTSHQSFQWIFRVDFLEDWPLSSLLSKGLSRVFSSTTIQKHQFFGTQSSLWSNLHPYMTTGKTIALTIWTFVGKVMPLIFSTLSRFVIAFLPRSTHLLISWL